MSVVVAMVIPVTVVISMTVRMLLHAPVFYVESASHAASQELLVVGLLTTLSCEFIDASHSRCHYQKRYNTAHSTQGFTGVIGRGNDGNEHSHRQIELLGRTRLHPNG